MLRSVSHVNPRADSPHVPVLHREVVSWLDLEPGMTVVDGTFGAGGHARLLADAMDGRGCYVAVDRDPGVRGHFAAFAHDHPDLRTRFVRGNFALALRNLAATGVKADAVLLDLGISSMQIDQTDRGFAYATDAPLDMRMDPAEPRTAADLVNELDERTLARIIHKYGEERYASQIARAIVRRRAQEPFSRSGDLVETVRRAIPTPAQFGAGPSGEARLPGAPDRRQRRARRTRGRARVRARDAPPGRPGGGDLVPLAGGPDREDVLPRRAPAAASARPTCRSAAAGTSRSCAC